MRYSPSLRASRALTASVAGTALLCLATVVPAQQPAAEGASQESPARETQQQLQERLGQAVNQLPASQRDWIRSVFGLITIAELEYFVESPEYRRDAFVEEFWRVRDPDPRTSANELKERFDELRGSMGPAFTAADPRYRLFLLNGPPSGWSLPDGRAVSVCLGKTRELEIWFYSGSPRTAQRFIAVFQRRAAGRAYELWRPGDSLRPIQRSGLPSQDVRVLCAEELLGYAQREMSRIGNYDQLIETVLRPPQPSSEWLAGLRLAGTAVPEGAKTFEVLAQVAYPTRRQSRTGMQVVVPVPRDVAPGRRFGAGLAHNFELIGEILREGKLFEEFRYRFEGPTDETTEVIPLGFTRFLRPGPVQLKLRLEDVYGQQYAGLELDLEVPSPEGRETAPGTSLAQLRPQGPDTALRLIAPGSGALAGKRRFETRATGQFDRVAFFLDDKQVLAKRNPPYSVELDLGEAPTPRTVRVVGYRGGTEVATDKLWLNQGQQRFAVRLIEPRPGGLYPGGLTARASLQAPAGQQVMKVEFFRGEELIRSLDAEPFEAPMRLGSEPGQVVRVVATLADGTRAEDAVVVGGNTFVEAVEVTAVEIFFRALDRAGEPIRDLALEELRVTERSNGSEIEQIAETLEPLAESPLQVALALDVSASMAPALDGVRAAAKGFISAVVAPAEQPNRIGVLTFAETVDAVAPLVESSEAALRAVAGVGARGRTALFDAIAEGARFLEGARGPKVVVLVTDGRDDSSRLSFEQTLAAVEASGVVLMVVSAEGDETRREDRRRLRTLAETSGGEVTFVRDFSGLELSLAEALARVRAGWRLTYTRSVDSPLPPGAVASVRVEIDRDGAVVTSRRSVR